MNIRRLSFAFKTKRLYALFTLLCILVLNSSPSLSALAASPPGDLKVSRSGLGDVAPPIDPGSTPDAGAEGPVTELPGSDHQSGPQMGEPVQNSSLSKMIVVSASNQIVVQANLDGTGGTSLGNLSNTLNRPHGLALDLANGKMYVTNYGNHKVSQANLDGTAGVSLGNLSATLNRPYGIDLDSVNGKIYVTNLGDNTISQANLDGSGGISLGNLGGLLNSPHGIAVDPINGKIYIANFGDNSIIRSNLDGSGGVNLGNLNGTLNGPDGINLDLSNGEMYVTSNGGNTVSRAFLDGTGGVSLGDLNGTLSGPAEIALDYSTGKMYVANNQNNTISQANLDGTGGVSLGNLSGNLSWPNGIGLQLNTPPVAASDTFTVTEDSLDNPLDVLNNDSDIDGDPLTVSAVGSPNQGGSAINGGSVITYTPGADFFGTEVFTYTVADGFGGFDTAAITLTVTNLNDPPLAVDDNYPLDEDQILTVPAPGVLDNDTDIDGDTLLATVDSSPANGVLDLSPDGSFIYTPTLNYNGLDTFIYIASDGALTSTATVTITINSINDDPIVDAGTDQAGDEGAPFTFEGSFTDPGLLAAPVSPSILWDFGDGITTTGTLTPTHAYADNGVYTVTLSVSDGIGGVGEDWLLVTVDNVAPTLSGLPDQTITLGEGITATATITDPGWLDTHTATLSWGDEITDTIQLDAGDLDFDVPHLYDDSGQYLVTVTVMDDDGGQTTATFTVVVIEPVYPLYLPFVQRNT